MQEPIVVVFCIASHQPSLSGDLTCSVCLRVVLTHDTSLTEASRGAVGGCSQAHPKNHPPKQKLFTQPLCSSSFWRFHVHCNRIRAAKINMASTSTLFCVASGKGFLSDQSCPESHSYLRQCYISCSFVCNRLIWASGYGA